MKKSFLLIASAVIAGLFMSCASIPEPSEKNTDMICGNVEFEFTNDSNYDLLPDSDKLADGVCVVFENRKTHKKIQMTSNSKGEFQRVNVPEGAYRLYRMSKKVNANGYELEYGGVLKDGSQYYVFVHDGVVTNLGILKMKITQKHENTYYWSIYWNQGFNTVKNRFWNEHPDSSWIYKEWIDGNDTYNVNN